MGKPTRKRTKKTARTKKGAGSKPLKERALGPVADEFGKAFAPVGKPAGEVAAAIALSTLKNLVYGYTTISGWLKAALHKRLENVPPEKIAEPNPRIAVPAIQALTYSISDELIREMFANLIAADMNTDTKGEAHPAFVELIKEMTPLDARILRALKARPEVYFYATLIEHDKSIDLARHTSFNVEIDEPECYTSINNLERLGLLDRVAKKWPMISELEQHELIVEKAASEAHKSSAENIKRRGFTERAIIDIEKYGMYLTQMGKMFVSICIKGDEGTKTQ